MKQKKEDKKKDISLIIIILLLLSIIGMLGVNNPGKSRVESFFSKESLPPELAFQPMPTCVEWGNEYASMNLSERENYLERMKKLKESYVDTLIYNKTFREICSRKYKTRDQQEGCNIINNLGKSRIEYFKDPSISSGLNMSCTRYESVNLSTTYEQGKVCDTGPYPKLSFDCKLSAVCVHQFCHLPNLTWEEVKK